MFKDATSDTKLSADFAGQTRTAFKTASFESSMDFTVSWNMVFFFKDFLDLNFQNFASLSGLTQTSSAPLVVSAFIDFQESAHCSDGQF